MPGEPWHLRARDALVRFWKSRDPKTSAVRDVLVTGGFVMILLGSVWAYTGQSFPTQAPLVVIESGSMMHGPYGPCVRGDLCGEFDKPGFGRVGTIDPGDLVLVKDVDAIGEVETAFGAGGRSGYGGHGDVIVYHPERRLAPPSNVPVIHRAMLLIRVEPEGCNFGDASRGCRMIIPETCASEFGTYVRSGAGQSDWRAYCTGSSEPVTLDLERDGLFLRLIRYPCTGGTCPTDFRTGFLTKGDNNNDMDQPQITCCPVPLQQLVGKARGEIPWFGLIKLALYGNPRYMCGPGEDCQDPTRGTQWSLFRATAPWDIWVCLFLAIGAAVLIPVGFDFALNRIRERRAAKPPPPPP